MLSKAYFQNKKKNAPKVKISLIKTSFKSCLISPFSFKIKNNQKTNFLIDNEINLREILNNVLKKTNNIYENFYYNQIDIKLDNEQTSKRSKIIKYIKDFIEVNINHNKTAIFCEIIFFFDLLIIQNKKNKNEISFEKLGLGALILVLKFHRLQKNVFIKKYKSIFNDKYMTLDEIKKIEVSSLKMINYDITQPHPIYYIDLIFNNIFSFSSSNNSESNNNHNYRQIISLVKYILTFSNNYIKFHPFYLATFIIKYCLEQNKINDFHYKFILFFDINIRDFKTLYDEFLNIFKNQITIAKTLLKQKFEIKTKKIINKSLIYNKPSIVKIGNHNLASITISNEFGIKKEKKLNKNNVENNNNNIKNYCQTKLLMNSINNTCYKKFLDNYIEDNRNNSSKENNSIIVNLNKSIKSKNKSLVEINTYQNNVNCSIESPKKCGISINYRLKKNFLNKDIINDNSNTKINSIENNNNNKIKRSVIGYSLEKKIKKEYQKINKEEENINNKKNKRLNSELTHDKINHNYNFYNLRGDSIRKKYKSKNKEKNISMNLINENNENTEEINNKINNYKEKTEKIKVNTLNRINNYQNKISGNNNEKSKIYYYYDIIKKNYNDDSYFRNRSTINQSESSLINNRNINRENDIKKIKKLNIRNFYKNKNAILLKYKDFDKKDLFIS